LTQQRRKRRRSCRSRFEGPGKTG